MIPHTTVTEATEFREEFTAGGETYLVGPAVDRTARRKAYELVHRLYVEQGYTTPIDSGMWVNVHLLLPETVTIVAERAGEVVGTLSVVFDGPLGLPADLLYADEVDGIRVTGRRPCEVASLAISPDEKTASRQIMARLTNQLYVTARYVRGATDYVITVNPHHAAYYERMHLFDPLGPERQYGKVGGAPAVLLRLLLEKPAAVMADPSEKRALKRTIYRYYHSEDAARQMASVLRGRLAPMTEEEFAYFAMEATDVWDRAGVGERGYLAGVYTTALFAEIMGPGCFAEPPCVPSISQKRPIRAPEAVFAE
jgi:hypothetical protein